MSTGTQTADLDYSVAKATENIRKATRLGLTNLAQQIRRERAGYIAQRDEIAAAN